MICDRDPIVCLRVAWNGDDEVIAYRYSTEPFLDWTRII